MPRVPVGNKYTTTLTGSALKHVTCSYCGCQFVYQMKREASGEASSFLWLNNNGASYQSTKSANDNLNSKLQKEIDTVSCPDCGMYQEEMVKKLKGEAWSNTFSVAFSFSIIGAILAVIIFAITSSASNGIQSLLLIAVAVFWVWSVSKMAIRAYNLEPNANAHKRKGRHYSEKYPVLRLSELEELVQKSRRPLNFDPNADSQARVNQKYSESYPALKKSESISAEKRETSENSISKNFCQNCGNAIMPKDRFCRKCGVSLE